MKKLLIALCVLAMLIGCCVWSVAAAAEPRTAYCEHCDETVTWEPFVFGTTRKVEEGHEHYYLTSDRIYSAKSENLTVYDGATACLDLNGHRWECRGYAFYINNGTLNLMDSVGTAEIIGGNGSGSKTGGVVYVNGGTLNMYGGTYKLNGTYLPNNGGIIALYESGSTAPKSVMNMYGGTIVGATALKSGGAIRLYYNSELNLYGGRVIRGEAQGTGNDEGGDCINAGFAKGNSIVRLAGTAEVDEIMLFNNNKNLIVDESFTGWANIAFGRAVTDTAAEGLVIGACTEGYQGTGSLMFDAGDGFQVVNDGTDLKLAAIPEDVLYRTCDVCGNGVKFAWLPYAPRTEKDLPAGTHHRYLEHSLTESEAAQLSMGTAEGTEQLCLDLNGNGMEIKGRLASMSKGSVLNLMDSVGGGYVQGSSAGSNAAAGVVYVGTTGSDGKAVFNMYGGTLKFKVNDEIAKQTGRGGIIAINEGIVNLYDGTIEGAEMRVSSQWKDEFDNGSGGAIYVYGHLGEICQLNVYGGEIKNGKAVEGKPGSGVFVLNPNAVVTLYGDSIVENIYFNSVPKFAVTGTYTGSATITLADALVAENLVIGSAAGADLTGATITCTNGNGYYVPVEDGKLIISSLPNGTVALNGETAYGSVQDAVNAYEGGVIALCKSVNEDVNITKDVTIQLAGYELSGNITVVEGATLYGMDVLTDDFDVSDGKYGKLSGVTGNVSGVRAENGEAENDYLAINQEGVWSFHAVKLEIYAMTLSVGENGVPGLYYKSNFKADQMAAEQISSFGVALSVFGTPNAENLESVDVKYSVHNHFEAGPDGNLGNYASTLLNGILKDVNSNAVNKRNLNIPVYGRAYAKSADGQILFGAGVCRSLAEQLKAVDAMVDTLSENQTAAVVKLYNTFKSVLADAKLTNIEAAVEAEEDGTLKVLVLGNSHGLDATRMLYEVFYTENPDQQVVIGALYESGCRMDEHYDFLTGNKPMYDYYKNDGSNADRAWSVKENATCLEALQDEQWDMILMQQMNYRAGMDYETDNWYIAEEWKTVAEYLLNNQDIQPKLGFHMTWANPDDYELYLKDDAPLGYSSISGWRKTHETYFAGEDGKYDNSVLYNEVVRCVQKYVVDSTDFLGKAYFDGPVIASATAVQYALDVQGHSLPEIYRDYTHLNDYGRLMVAYLWYAQIMELEEITEVNINAIPEALRNKSSLYPAAESGYAITEEMKADLIESVNWALEHPFELPQ